VIVLKELGRVVGGEGIVGRRVGEVPEGDRGIIVGEKLGEMGEFMGVG